MVAPTPIPLGVFLSYLPIAFVGSFSIRKGYCTSLGYCKTPSTQFYYCLVDGYLVVRVVVFFFLPLQHTCTLTGSALIGRRIHVGPFLFVSSNPRRLKHGSLSITNRTFMRYVHSLLLFLSVTIQTMFRHSLSSLKEYGSSPRTQVPLSYGAGLRVSIQIEGWNAFEVDKGYPGHIFWFNPASVPNRLRVLVAAYVYITHSSLLL